MSTKKNINNEVIIACPHCLVCSVKLSAEEYASVESGQVLIEVCQVCGREVILNAENP